MQRAITVWFEGPLGRRADEISKVIGRLPHGPVPGRTRTTVIDAEFFDTAQGIALSGADLSQEELTLAVVPEQVEEFTCACCFPVLPPSEAAGGIHLAIVAGRRRPSTARGLSLSV